MLTESMRLFCLKDLLEREGKKLLFKELPKMVSLISAVRLFHDKEDVFWDADAHCHDCRVSQCAWRCDTTSPR